MNRRQIFEEIFGHLSDEESASSHEIEQQPEFNSGEKDGGSERINDAMSSQQVEIDCGYHLDEDFISSSSSDEGVEREKQIVAEQGIKTGSGAELHHDAKSTWYNDGEVTFENKSTFGERVRTEGGTELKDEVPGLDNETRSSSLIQSENSKLQHRISEVIRSVFGDSDDDESAQYGAAYSSDQENNNSVSPEHKLDCERDLESEGTVSCEHAPSVPEKEKVDDKQEEQEKVDDKQEEQEKVEDKQVEQEKVDDKQEEQEKVDDKQEEQEKVGDKQEEQSICRMLVLEIPQRTPHADPSQMATTELSNIIGFDDKPFDPETYVEQDFYITDASGSERLIPPTNIIQWRNVKNDDGTISVQSNARIVNWSDGSLQLFIGNEAIDVTEEDITQILSHALLWNEGIYQSLRKIYKSVKVASSSSVPDSNNLTTLLDQNTTPVPETVKEQLKQADPQPTEDCVSPNLNNNDEKVTSNRNLKKSELCPTDVNHEGPKDPQ